MVGFSRFADWMREARCGLRRGLSGRAHASAGHGLQGGVAGVGELTPGRAARRVFVRASLRAHAEPRDPLVVLRRRERLRGAGRRARGGRGSAELVRARRELRELARARAARRAPRCAARAPRGDDARASPGTTRAASSATPQRAGRRVRPAHRPRSPGSSMQSPAWLRRVRPSSASRADSRGG